MKKQFHHVGMPTTEKQPNELYLADLDLYITDASAQPHHIEWIRRGPRCTQPEILGKMAHVAYEVENIEEALKGKNIIVPTWEALPGLLAAFILDDGAPVEYLQFK